MGYETKLYLADISAYNLPSENGLKYASIVGMVDLCKTGDGPFEQLRNSSVSKVPSVYFYNNSDEKITHDLYGSPIVVMDANEVLKALQKDNRKQNYRRFDLAIGLLKAAIKSYPGLKVLTYGY